MSKVCSLCSKHARSCDLSADLADLAEGTTTEKVVYMGSVGEDNCWYVLRAVELTRCCTKVSLDHRKEDFNRKVVSYQQGGRKIHGSRQQALLFQLQYIIIRSLLHL